MPSVAFPILAGNYTVHQSFGSGFIESGSGSSNLSWIPRIRIQSGSRVFWPKIEKNYSWQKICYFLSKIVTYFIPRPPYRTFKLQEKPSALKREHPAFSKNGIYLTFFYFCGLFLPSWIRIQSGSETLWCMPEFLLPSACRYLPNACRDPVSQMLQQARTPPSPHPHGSQLKSIKPFCETARKTSAPTLFLMIN